METAYARLCATPVCAGRKASGAGTLLLKDPSPPIEEATVRGITVSPHISKLEPVAFYAEASRVSERALGGGLTLLGGRSEYPFMK